MGEKTKNKALQIIINTLKGAGDFTQSDIEELRNIFMARFGESKSEKAADTIKRIFLSIEIDPSFGTKKAKGLVDQLIEKFPGCQDHKQSTQVVNIVNEVERLCTGEQNSVYDLKQIFKRYQDVDAKPKENQAS